MGKQRQESGKYLSSPMEVWYFIKQQRGREKWRHLESEKKNKSKELGMSLVFPKG